MAKITVDPLELANMAVFGFGAMQKVPEFAALIDLVCSGSPKTIMEIGIGRGGSSWAFSKIEGIERHIAIDLPNGPWGGCPELTATSFEYIAGDSQKVELPNTLVDFLFIDGDHSYAGVKADYERYSPLVRSGGLIAFHDICEHAPETGCEVRKFWLELRDSLAPENYTEFISTPENWGGIGVVKK